MKEQLLTIQWLSRALITVVLIMTSLTINKLVNNDEDFSKATSDLYKLLHGSVENIHQFQQINSEKSSEIVEQNIPLVNSLYNKYPLLKTHGIDYDGSESPFAFRASDDHPPFVETYPYLVLLFNSPSVHEIANFFADEYNNDATITYPDFNLFLKELTDAAKTRIPKGKWTKIDITYAKPTSVTQQIDNRMDNFKSVRVICNFRSYRDFSASITKEGNVLTSRIILDIPYKHVKIPGTSLKSYKVFLKQRGFKFNFDDQTLKSKTVQYKSKLDEIGDQSGYALPHGSTEGNDLNISVNIGPVTINVKILLYIFPLILIFILGLTFFLTRAFVKEHLSENQPIENPKKELLTHYYPIHLNVGITQKIKNVFIYFIVVPLICIVFILFTYMVNISVLLYILYSLSILAVVYFTTSNVALVKSLRN